MYFVLPHKHLHLGLVQNELLISGFSEKKRNSLLRGQSFMSKIDQNLNVNLLEGSILKFGLILRANMTKRVTSLQNTFLGDLFIFYKIFSPQPSHSCILNAAYLAPMYSTQWEIQTKVEIIWRGKSTNSSHPTAKRNVHEYSSQTEIQAWL